MRALIDGDLILYKACHAVQGRMYIAYNEEGEPLACSPRKRELPECAGVKYTTMIDEDSYNDGCIIIDNSIDAILRATHSHDDYVIYLTGKGNFRHDIYDEYKSHRPEKPMMYKVLKEYMMMDATLVEGQEADDAMGINQDANSIICSYDKDMLMIPGKHYQFNKREFITITPEQGILNFYKQLLTGDSTDNIPGLKGVGPKTAEKILDGVTTEEEMYEKVLFEYWARCTEKKEDVKDIILRNARLLWIRQEEDELWLPPSTTVTSNEPYMKAG